MPRARELLFCIVWGLAIRPARADGVVEIPAHNRAELREAPPRPSEGDLQTRAARLFEALQKDDPALAEPVFFPREAFLRVKAMKQPERYYDRLHARFHTDIHALHRSLPDLPRATFVRLGLSPRGGWIKAGDEGNRLPYWASRHAALHYKVDGKPKQLEVRVLITWDDRWYVIHLSEFH